MKLSNKITKFQDGGAAPQGSAPDPSQGGGGAPQGGDPSQGQDPSQGGGQQDPVAQLVQMAQQALQSKDCQAALAVCDGLLQVLSQAQGGGQGAQGGQGDPSQGGGDPSQQGAPVYKRGGQLVRRTK
jgi:hypothetical protein